MSLNLVTAWSAILAGLVSGTLIGLFFHRDEWMGGFGSWSRRLIRLGHISFFGTGFLNLAFAFTVRELGLQASGWLSSMLFVVGAVSMPLVCFLSAWHKPMRHLFAIPVLSLLGATIAFLIQMLTALGRMT